MLKESVYSPAIGIQNPSSCDKGSGIRNPWRRIQTSGFPYGVGDFTIAALFGSLEQATRMIR